LEILLSVENNLFGLNLSVFDINFVSNQNNWDVFANSDEIFVPLWNVLICDSGADIEHDNTTVTTNVISISESSKLLLTGGIPYVEKDHTFAGIEWHWVDFDTEGSDVFLFEFTGKMSLDECGFTDTTITDENEFVFSNWTCTLHNLKLSLLVNFFCESKLTFDNFELIY
jgi:hypothetical protein